MATFFKTDAFEDSTCKASYYLTRSYFQIDTNHLSARGFCFAGRLVYY